MKHHSLNRSRSVGLIVLGLALSSCLSTSGRTQATDNQPPLQRLDFDGNALRLVLDGRTVAASIDGKAVKAILDTGAPGVGVSQANINKSSLAFTNGVETRAYLPAFEIMFPVKPAILNNLTLGSATFRFVPVGVGFPSEDDAKIMARQGVGSDVIFGLDLFRPFFTTAVFDYADKSVVFERGLSERADDLRQADLTDDGKYVVDVEVGGTVARMLIDTGSKNNTVSRAYAKGVPCYGYRTYKRRWGAFSERLIPLTLTGDAAELRWVQVRDFATDEAKKIVGVLGEINGGRLTLDLKTNGYRWDWASADAMTYDYEPAAQSKVCPEI